MYLICITMHECDHFILGKEAASLIQYNDHAVLVHTLWQRKKRERDENLIPGSKNTASSAKQYYFLLYMVRSIFLSRTSRQKNYIGGKTGEAATFVPGVRITSRTLWTTTNKLEAGPAAKGRVYEGQKRGSHDFFLLDPRCFRHSSMGRCV